MAREGQYYVTEKGTEYGLLLFYFAKTWTPIMRLEEDLLWKVDGGDLDIEIGLSPSQKASLSRLVRLGYVGFIPYDEEREF